MYACIVYRPRLYNTPSHDDDNDEGRQVLLESSKNIPYTCINTINIYIHTYKSKYIYIHTYL